MQKKKSKQIDAAEAEISSFYSTHTSSSRQQLMPTLPTMHMHDSAVLC